MDQVDATFLEQPTVMRAKTEPIFHPGDVLDGVYELKRLIGQGGMGYVYEARDIGLNRRVAIKLAKAESWATQLIREARIMAAFMHPGLPLVYALGKHEDMDYVVMEYLHGKSLAAHLIHVQPIFAPDDAHRLLMSVARSLEVLHHAHLVHRDLKPANIMLVPPDRVVLLDFGLSDQERYAPRASVGGSPHYMAPEVIACNVKEGQAHLSDIYSLGAVGFHLVSGRPLFMSNSIAELLEQHLHQPPPELRDLRADVPTPLAALIMEMVSKAPADRPHSISGVIERLQQMDLSRPDPAAQTLSEAPIRILVADDQKGMWELIAYVFEEHGYEITYVEDGNRALAEFKVGTFDIVITDKNMPGLDGIELTAAVKQLRPSTDVILITGYPSKTAAVDALNSGVSRFIEKPFDLDELALIVEEYAARQRALRQVDVWTRP